MPGSNEQIMQLHQHIDFLPQATLELFLRSRDVFSVRKFDQWIRLHYELTSKD
jgi:hypothetical protein